jgi:uncharacterized protein YndB with AHSA1/START domain
MAKILLRFPVEAPPDRVFEAVATHTGVTGWWSERSAGPAGGGSTLSVSFPDAPITFDFDVAEEQPGRRVVWHCVAGPPEWIGTDVSFDVESGDDGVTVLFTHDRWTTTEQSFPFIAYSWAQILPRLKHLAETGERNPFFRFAA